MKRILVPLDGSPLSESILPIAEEWAKDEEAEVSLLRAVHAHRVPGLDDVNAQVRVVEDGEAYLKEVADRLERRGLKPVHWAVWYDEPAKAIALAVTRYAIDLVAMATHGRGGLSRLLLGSVAEAVVRSVQVPVLLLRGQSAWKAWANGKMLVPLDGLQTAEAILPIVERLAGPRDLIVSLLEVIEPLPSAVRAESTQLDDLITLRREEAQGYLAKVADALKAKGLRVEWSLAFGHAAETIADIAAEKRADLIAMATHGRTGLERLFLGSVAEGVLRRASIPVLLFKANERSNQ